MARAPADTILDHLAEPVLVDPSPALVRVCARADDYAHSLVTRWGWPGLWVPLHLLDNNALEFKIAVPPAVQYMHLTVYVSGRGSVEFTSAAIGAPGKRTLEWNRSEGGDDIASAYEVATTGALGTSSGPLQVRSGVSWSPTLDTITVNMPNTSKGKTGHAWGVLVEPIHESA